MLRDLVLCCWQRNDHWQLPVHRQSVALVRTRIFFTPQHAVFGQECLQPCHHRALAIDINGARACQRNPLSQQLWNMLWREGSVHAAQGITSDLPPARGKTSRGVALDRAVVPFDTAANHAVEASLTVGQRQRVREDWIPPVRIFEPVRGRCHREQLRADLRPQMT